MRTLVVIVTVILALCVLLASAKQAQSPAPQLPGRVPMSAHLLTPSAEWTAYYDVVPEGERRLYWTSKVTLDALRETLERVKALEARVEVLELAEQGRAIGPAVEANQCDSSLSSSFD